MFGFVIHNFVLVSTADFVIGYLVETDLVDFDLCFGDYQNFDLCLYFDYCSGYY